MSAQRRPLGELVRHHRWAAGLSQEALAERAGLSRRGVSDIERGIIQAPHHDTMIRLAEALHLARAEREAFEAAAHGRWSEQHLEHLPSHLSPGSMQAPLVGREDELDLIDRHLADKAGPLLVFAGEPGIGKSRMLAEAALRASAQGWRVIMGGCTRRSGEAPYEPLVSALAREVRLTPPARQRLDLQGCGWLVRLLPELLETHLAPAPTWTLAPEQERRLMFGAVARYLANAAGPAGTLLLLDDLQWAGGDALALVETLVEEAVGGAGAPLRLLGAYRATEVRSEDPLGLLLADLVREGRVVRRQLPLLTSEEASTLLAQLCPEDAETPRAKALREETVRRADGLPFYLVSSARALQDAQEAAQADAAAGHDQVPTSVAESIRARVAGLPAAARRLVGAAAVVGRIVSGALLVGLTSRSEEATLDALDMLVDAGLLVEEGEARYRFTHDLIREVAESELGSQRRRMLHRRVAEALEQGVGPPQRSSAAEITAHYIAASEQQRALPYALLAGDEAAAIYAHEAAGAHYRLAIDLATACGDEQVGAQAQLRLGQALTLLGQLSDGESLLKEARTRFRTLDDPGGWAQTERALSINRGLNGYAEESLSHLLTARDLLEPIASARDLALTYHWLSGAYLLLSRHREELASAEQALAYARQTADPLIVAQVEMRYGGALIRQGRIVEGCAIIDGHFPQYARVGGSTDYGVVLWNSIEGHLALGDFSTAQRYVASAVEGAEVTGDGAGKATVPWFQALVAFYEGRWGKAHAALAEACERSQAAGLPMYPYYLMFSGHLTYLCGAPERARASQEHAFTLIEQRRLVWFSWHIEAALADQDLVEGRPADVARRLASLLEPFGNEPHFNALPLVPRLAQAYLDMGQVAEAKAAVSRAIARAADMNHRLVLVDALRVRALVAIQRRAWEAAAGALDEALDLARAIPYPYAEAKALCVYGQLHSARAEVALARGKYEEALAVLNRLGERPYAERIEQDLDMIS